MLITSVRPINEATKRESKRWLMDILNAPGLQKSVSFPESLGCCVYVDGRPRWLTYGHWEIGGSLLHLPAPGTNIAILDRLAILSAFASINGLMGDPEVQTLVTTRLCDLIKEATMNVYQTVIGATEPPRRLAVKSSTNQIASEIAGQWFLPGGSPVTVDDTWITMDF